MSSNRIAPLVAVLHIGVQGKILFALRGLLLKKKVGKPLTRPSAPNWSPRSPRFWGRLFTLPSTTGHLSLLALLGALANLSSRDHGQVTTMPCSEAFTPGWKERLFSERGKGLDSQKRSLPGTKMGSFDLSCPFQLEGQWKPQRLFCQGKLETLFQSHIVPWDQLLARKAEYGSQFLNLFHFFKNKGNKSNCHFSEIKQVERAFLAFWSPKGQIGTLLRPRKEQKQGNQVLQLLIPLPTYSRVYTILLF